MRPRTQKQPQVKKELCRVLDKVNVKKKHQNASKMVVAKYCSRNHANCFFSSDVFVVVTVIIRLLQRQRHVKMELCLGLSVLRLFQVGHVVQNTFACLARMVFMHRQKMKDLLLRARVVVRTSKMKI